VDNDKIINLRSRNSIHNKSLNEIIKASYYSTVNKNIIPIQNKFEDNFNNIPNFEDTNIDDLIKKHEHYKKFDLMPKLKDNVTILC
jgi:endonuclease III-like uncharacterized protein